MNRRVIIIPLVVAGLLAGGWFIDRNRAASESTLSGFFENEPTLTASRIGGRVEKILVKEGDVVHKGQPLVLMEDQSIKSSVEAQKAAEEQAQENYHELAAGSRPEDIAKQRDTYLAAKATYEKMLNGPRPAEIQAEKAKVESLRAVYKKMLAGSRPQDIAAARAAAGAAMERLRQSERGLTTEERNQLKARWDQAVAAEVLAKKELDRYAVLYSQGAISRENYDTQISNYKQAQAHTQDAQQAYQRAEEGTPKEELGEAQQSYRQARAQLDLVLAGNRKEDIESARANLATEEQNYKLLLEGNRKEDIAQAKAQMDQAHDALVELEHGNRWEDVAKAKSAQQQAALQTESQAQNLAERKIVSPLEGRVDRVLVADGDLVTANANVIQLSDPTDIWVRVYLPEDQLSKIKAGDSADLQVDGVSGEVQGLVESIDQNGQFTPANLQSPDERAKQVFGVRIRLAKADARVKSGMYATVKGMGAWKQ
ncbi:MAG TPA: HlyD family efflux transporter periplasmic adaptor subunit [Fimbriimonadaceae bacterium]|jgi:multidrug resistance efflux pump